MSRTVGDRVVHTNSFTQDVKKNWTNKLQSIEMGKDFRVNIGDVIQDNGGTRWQLLSIRGQGTCCCLYKAQCIGDPRSVVAVKVFRPGDNFALACEKEWDILQIPTMQQCRQSVRVLDRFTWNGHPCLMEELLDASVKETMHQAPGGRLPLFTIQLFLRNLLGVLEHLHSAGIVHGDIKPANLLWSPEQGALKLIDFGLSFFDHRPDMRYLQSPGYRSPETTTWNNSHAQQGEACSATLWSAADIWSVGCIAMEIVSGEKLFSSKRGDAEPTVCPSCQGSPTARCQYNQLIDQWFDRLAPTVIGPAPSYYDYVLFSELKDFISRCLVCHSSQRDSASQLRQHSLLNRLIVPSIHDMMLLPSPILRLENVADDIDLDNPAYREGIKFSILEICASFGPVVTCLLPTLEPVRGRVYVEFQRSEDCTRAVRKLPGMTFNNRTLVTAYLPLSLWACRQLL
ncbi:PREDICTED: serine/threonine-protein kinase Kist-like [Priapulus caudatus]|uniref:Serine/threonine-protein kinase Kist-like n=1 Tax=Priapulus caudatus TaxID=37621 RepID=A0ABM1FB76_PRICU|nr:PREDICTED: serine/threonine-protein kinase Kist-like [Priapulus caudatus]